MRASALEADDDRIPEWPDEHACHLCGCPVWKVTAPDGSAVTLHSEVIETEIMVGTDCEPRRIRRRSSYKLVEALEVGGWRLDDPFRVKHGDDAGWHWYASRETLRPERDDTLYSEHVYVCRAASRAMVMAHLHKTCGMGDAAGDPKAKQRGALMRALKAAERQRVEEWTRAGKQVPLLSDRGVSVGSEQMSLNL
jgi:hypothetical protein